MKPKSPLILKKFKPGVFLLLGIGLGVVLMLVLLLFENGKTPTPITDKEKNTKKENVVFQKNKTEFARGKRNSYKFQPFNPNNINKEQLMSFGLSPKQASILVNYVNAGGRFKTKQDLKKLYFMTEDLYSQMSPFIVIEPSIQPTNTSYTNTYSNNKYISKPQPIFDLNKADTIDLQALRGIGPSYSRRIFKYGQKLGGYVRIEQLKEVYGMTDTLYTSIKPYLKINNPNPKKLNLNTSTIKELNSHPYIDFYLAKAIVKLRFDLKTFKSIEEIKQIHLLDQETYNKLIPYLEL
ncbi:MAG TPA: hypothetical protein DD434_08675 [Bacteroidales bacterium]|nr:hypothetical protein [Bacteroidales bacterium]